MENTTVLDLTNNKAQLIGSVGEEEIKIFENNGENFYDFILDVPRLSGVIDKIPVTMPKNLADSKSLTLKQGLKLALSGEFRSRNIQDSGKSHLILFFFAREILQQENDCQSNDCQSNTISLTGFLCKSPVYRDTPFGRQICDILLAVNRAHNKKSDYIPCIIWGRNAVFVKSLPVGTKLNLSGRIQSRNYNKQEGDKVVQKTAYEISVNNLKVFSSPDELSEEA